VRGAAADDVAEHPTRRERQRDGYPPEARRLDRGAREDDEREAERDQRERMLALACRIGDLPVRRDDRHDARDHPPPRRQAEEIEEQIGEPRAERATAIGDRIARAGVREAGIAARVRGEDQREIRDDRDHQQPPRFTDQTRRARCQRTGRCHGPVPSRFSVEKQHLEGVTSRDA
jgi:hypothetical protein